MLQKGNIPVILVEGKNIPEVWEKSVIKLWEEGVPIKTEYDKETDPPARDAVMIMMIEEPLSEPRIHRGFPGGLEDLEIYRLEVVEGIHDDWISPEKGQWSYTYHKRLFSYEVGEKVIDQIDYIVQKLSTTWYTRRAQAITYHPQKDNFSEDPPCLQRLWCRLHEDENKELMLNMNTHWRSRDAYKAAFMNIFALTDLQRIIAEKISEKMGKKIRVGRYVDISDSYHIYGSYEQEFSGFLEMVKNRPFASRVFTSDFAEEFFEEARKKVKK